MKRVAVKLNDEWITYEKYRWAYQLALDKVDSEINMKRGGVWAVETYWQERKWLVNALAKGESDIKPCETDNEELVQQIIQMQQSIKFWSKHKLPVSWITHRAYWRR